MSPTIYHMLKDGAQFQDLGADHFDRRSKDVNAWSLSSQTLASMPSSLPSPKRAQIVAMLQSKRRSSDPHVNLVRGTAGERAERSVAARRCAHCGRR